MEALRQYTALQNRRRKRKTHRKRRDSYESCDPHQNTGERRESWTAVTEGRQIVILSYTV